MQSILLPYVHGRLNRIQVRSFVRTHHIGAIKSDEEKQ